MRREKRRAEFEERYLAARERLREKRQRKNLSPRLPAIEQLNLGDDTGGWQTERRDENRTKLSAAGFNLGVK
jgi:hypothetical protein